MLALLFLLIFCLGISCYILGKGAGRKDALRGVVTYSELSDDSRKRLREKLSK